MFVGLCIVKCFGELNLMVGRLVGEVFGVLFIGF